jgi:hypothetical protein
VPRDHHAVSGEFECSSEPSPDAVDPDADTQPIVVPKHRLTDAKPGRKARFG